MTRKELEQTINSLEFEMSLWEKVKLAPEGSECPYINATLDDSDPLFPYMIVSGYNEANGREETYSLMGWIYCNKEDSRADILDEYERTGESPALSPFSMVHSIIWCRIINLKGEILHSKEALAKMICDDNQQK